MNQQEEFLNAYIAAALWSTNDESTEEGGYPLDENYDETDLAEETRQSMKEDCEKFFHAHYDDIEENVSQAGHDFWLTRNGHGAGFWCHEEYWTDEVGKRLTKACEKWGEVYLYVGDGKIYE